jgi:5-methylcytosine-specific restriction endonuclease McrA
MGKLSEMSMKILKVMQEHPQGITEGEIREILKIQAKDQSNFGRRRRELNSIYEIERRQDGPRTLYVYKGSRATAKDTTPISTKLRAHILHLAKGRCGMCGRTIEEHKIALHVDHKVPRDLGGDTEVDNLWAICETCNEGKKNHFKSIATPEMLKAMAQKSVHMRLGEALKASKGKPVPAETLHVIANQDDWKKRIRELRYLGWKIETHNAKSETGKVSSYYTLVEHHPWPSDPTAKIRKYERDRAAQNRESADES